MTAFDRVTVSLPANIRRQAQRLAEAEGATFSAVVTSALEEWMRGKLMDEWLRDYQDEAGAFSEDELRAIASRTGMPYLPPREDGR